MVLWWPPEYHTGFEEDQHWRGVDLGDNVGTSPHIARHDPTRELWVVEAHRRILAEHARKTALVVKHGEGVPGLRHGSSVG